MERMHHSGVTFSEWRQSQVAHGATPEVISTATECPAPPRAERPGFVYLAVDSDGLYKVGATAHLRSRFNQYKHSREADVRLLAAFPTLRAFAVERKIHVGLSDWSTTGHHTCEWYRFSSDGEAWALLSARFLAVVHDEQDRPRLALDCCLYGSPQSGSTLSHILPDGDWFIADSRAFIADTVWVKLIGPRIGLHAGAPLDTTESTSSESGGSR